MPVKIRLQRHGKKGKPFYWIVAADSRAKRDGKYLEKLGIYNPNTNPATIEINIDNSVQWLQNGAQPTDTARAILSYKGILLKHHLLGGLRKGALTEAQVDEKFNNWLEEKQQTIGSKVDGLDKEKADARKKALAAEKEVNEKRAMAAVEAETPEATEAEEAATPDAATTEAPAEVAEAQADTKEQTAAPKEPAAPKEEVKSEAVVEEAKEEKAPAEVAEVQTDTTEETAAPEEPTATKEDVKAEAVVEEVKVEKAPVKTEAVAATDSEDTPTASNEEE